MMSIGRVDRFRLWKTSHEAVLSDTATHLVLAWRGSCDPLQELVREWCAALTQVEQEASLRKPEARKQLIVTFDTVNNNQWSHHRHTPSGCGFSNN